MFFRVKFISSRTVGLTHVMYFYRKYMHKAIEVL